MAHRIRYNETLSDAEREQLFGWGKDIFGVEDLSLEWHRKDWHVLLETDGLPASHVGLLNEPVAVKAGDEVLRVVGIGGVVTVPMYRLRGYARETLAATIAFAQSWLVADARRRRSAATARCHQISTAGHGIEHLWARVAGGSGAHQQPALVRI